VNGARHSFLRARRSVSVRYPLTGRARPIGTDNDRITHFRDMGCRSVAVSDARRTAEAIDFDDSLVERIAKRSMHERIH
jgi:hypothetical protein